jgi:hypothetical protein
MALQRYEAPSFSPDETNFLRHYAETLDRVAAMRASGLAAALQLDPEDENQLAHVATGVIRKAERLSLADIATAIGADPIAMLRRIWDICNSPEGHEAIKGLQLLARIHGVWTEKLGGSRQAVQIVLGQPVDTTAASPPPGLPFRLDMTTG